MVTDTDAPLPALIKNIKHCLKQVTMNQIAISQVSFQKTTGELGLPELGLKASSGIIMFW